MNIKGLQAALLLIGWARLSWNQINITTYITNDGELLHPNTAGNNRMAQVYVGGLRDLEPVT